MNFKNIVLVVLIILIFAGTFMFLMAHQAHPKDASKIMMTSSDNLTEGDNITVKLTDANNTPLANQVLNFSIVSFQSSSLLSLPLKYGLNGIMVSPVKSIPSTSIHMEP